MHTPWKWVILYADSQFPVDVASSLDPSLPKGAAGATKGKPYILKYDTSKASRILGLKPRTLEDSVKDSVEYFKTLPGAY